MKLKKVIILAGAENRTYNKIKDSSCASFEVPFIDFNKLKFFIDFGLNKPSIINLFIYDLATNTSVPTLTNEFIVGQSGIGYYGVFTKINTQAISNFVLQFSVQYEDASVENFEGMEFKYCDKANFINSCYGAKQGQFNFYDFNGIYYGYPNSILFGTSSLKYTFESYLLDEIIVDDDTKDFTNEIVNNTVANTTITYNGIMGNMLYPYEFGSYIESLLMRGEVFYNGKKIIIENITSKKGCCGLDIIGKTKRIETQEYLCDCESLIPFICLPPVIDSVDVDSNTDIATIIYTSTNIVEYSIDGVNWTIATPNQFTINITDYPVTLLLRAVCGATFSSIVSYEINKNSTGFNVYVTDHPGAPLAGFCIENPSLQIAVYSNGGVTTGNSLYIDQSLTIPVFGYTFVRAIGSSTIYTINNVGLIGLNIFNCPL